MHADIFSRRVQSIKISATKLMPMLATEVGGCVSLGQGVPSFTTPAHVVEAVCRALTDAPGAGKYSLQPGMPELRAAAAELLEKEKGLHADPKTEIAVTVGGMEGLLISILALVDEGDQVVLPAPYYPSHVEQILLAQGKPVPVPLNEEDWSLDIDALRKAVTEKTKLIIINTPHNPTGTVFSEETLRKVADIALEHDLYVVCDDAYDFLAYDEPAFSLASLPQLRERLIGVFSFSKRYALTGWRVGFVYAPRMVMDQILKIHDCTAICAPTVSQHAALAALLGPQDLFAEFRDRLNARRELICSLLDEMPESFSYVRPKGAFYVMPRYNFTNENSARVAERLIREARVITIPGDSFGPGGERRLRMSFGGSEEEIKEAFARLRKFTA